VAVAAAGPIPFVALIAPQVAMRMVRSAGPPVFAGGLVGAVLVVGSDVVSRTALPVELPVGVLTAAIGAPYLLYLIARRTRRENA
jgi:iron complex transport system permease protein